MIGVFSRALVGGAQGFWTADLDPYAAAFAAAGQKMVAVEWTQNLAPAAAASTPAGATPAAAPTTFYSFIVRVPRSIIFLEFMSAKRPFLVPSPRCAPLAPASQCSPRMRCHTGTLFYSARCHAVSCAVIVCCPRHATLCLPPLAYSRLAALGSPVVCCPLPLRYRSPHPRFVFPPGGGPDATFGAALASPLTAALASLGVPVAGDGPTGPGRRFSPGSSAGGATSGAADEGDAGGSQTPGQLAAALRAKPPLFAARLSHVTTDAGRDRRFYESVSKRGSEL